MQTQQPPPSPHTKNKSIYIALFVLFNLQNPRTTTQSVSCACMCVWSNCKLSLHRLLYENVTHISGCDCVKIGDKPGTTRERERENFFFHICNDKSFAQLIYFMWTLAYFLDISYEQKKKEEEEKSNSVLKLKCTHNFAPN